MNVGNHQTKQMGAAAGRTLDLAHHVHDGTEGLLRLLDRDSAAAADGMRLGEILKPLARQKGYFTSGKYDQYNRDSLDLSENQSVFDVVGHLNSAGDLVSDPAERLSLARMSLEGRYLMINRRYRLGLEPMRIAGD
ncbi:hypothetical protein ACMHYB_22550 [Sorangium sp. So ce1128]